MGNKQQDWREGEWTLVFGLSLQCTLGTQQCEGGTSEILITGGRGRCEYGLYSAVVSLPRQYKGGPSERLLAGGRVFCEHGFGSTVVRLPEQYKGGPSERLLAGGQE